MPDSNDVAYIIKVHPLETNDYFIPFEKYEAELFKEFYVSKHLLSTLKTNGKMINVLASIFAKENGYAYFKS